MGGGHVTRPDFALGQPDAQNPMTEFYLILQKALGGAAGFALPGAYVTFQPPANENVYAEDIRSYCTFYGAPGPGRYEIFAPSTLSLLSEELCLAAGGAPAALVLTDATHRTVAVQLSPPVALEPLPALPACRAALRLSLSDEDMILADAAPAVLMRRMAQTTVGKCWLSHPRIEAWLMQALGAAQRAYRRSEGGTAWKMP